MKITIMPSNKKNQIFYRGSVHKTNDIVLSNRYICTNFKYVLEDTQLIKSKMKVGELLTGEDIFTTNLEDSISSSRRFSRFQCLFKLPL